MASSDSKDQLEAKPAQDDEPTNATTTPVQQGGHYSDQQNIDAECEKLLWNTKRQVKQMMEEAVTKKFIHEESSSIISLCVAIDACLSHGLKRRALGLFKTNSSTALVRKASRECKPAQEILDMVDSEEKRQQEEQQQQLRKSSASNQSGSNPDKNANCNHKSPVRQVASNSLVHKRNMWIKCALIEKKLVSIVEYLAENSAKYYEPDALMSNLLCAQILSSLLVGPCALEFSRSKTNDYYQFEEPSADELLKRHKLSNPIACLCNRPSMVGAHRHTHASYTASHTDQLQTHQHQLARSATDSSGQTNDDPESGKLGSAGSDNQLATPRLSQPVRPVSPSNGYQASNQKESALRRRPLSLKTNVKTGTIVTDCHHYSCQDITEHQQVRGYSFWSLSSLSLGQPAPGSGNQSNGLGNQQTRINQSCGAPGCAGGQFSSSGLCNGEWSLWSPRMLHETLHQNSKSKLLYAKNNVLLETQLRGTMAGYLSLHQTSCSDLILKWIPNQMINGSQQCVSGPNQAQLSDNPCSSSVFHGDETLEAESCPMAASTALESSYLDLVVNLSVSRIVLLHCQFAKCPRLTDRGTFNEAPTSDQSVDQTNEQVDVKTEETLILVEADGIQRAPFKFPKGGLRWFLSCLESGLSPGRYLDPAIKPEDGFPDPLRSPPPISSPSDTLYCPSGGFLSPPAEQSFSGYSSSGGSRLDVLLRRLPSLKRTNPVNYLDGQQSGSRCTSPDQSPAAAYPRGAEQQKQASSNTLLKSYVYRIVSIQQPEWPLQTPPHSALSVGSSSSGSMQTSLSRQTSGGTATTIASAASGQKFRWSLSRLAKLSSRYTNSGGSTSSLISVGCNGSQREHSAADKESIGTNSLYDQTSMLGEEAGNRFTDDGGDQRRHERSYNSRDLARIETKLDDLKKSTSDDLLALRTQSIQTLCESMRKQILARAFYGWLAYCRRAKIMRLHLLKLIRPAFHCHLLRADAFSPKECEDVHSGLTRAKWDELMTNRRANSSESQMQERVNQLVYYGGVESDELRREVWPYLLGRFKFKDTDEARKNRVASIKAAYEECGREWIKVERVVKQRDREILAANMAKANEINKAKLAKTHGDSQESEAGQEDDSITGIDNNNNDNQASDIAEVDSVDNIGQEDSSVIVGTPESLKLASTICDQANNNETKLDTTDMSLRNQRAKKAREAARLAAQRRRKRSLRLESTGSVGSDASITDQFGNNVHRIDKDVQRCDRNFWYFKDTNNLDKLRNIMCTYVWQHLDVGYVQGMCDLAAPFLVIFDDEVMAFSCFSQLMKRMVANFPHGNAMDQHFESLKYLMQVLDPKLFEVLQSNGDYTHFYFCYRWLLLDFKRELAYEDVYRVWETIWSARHIVTDHFVVFMAFSMVRHYRDIIIENNMDFTDTIKFFNEMAERHDARKIIAQARDYIAELESQIRVL